MINDVSTCLIEIEWNTVLHYGFTVGWRELCQVWRRRQDPQAEGGHGKGKGYIFIVYEI